ncbi:MAG: hypothetical protein RSE58_09845 [Clostridia bacterium]
MKTSFTEMVDKGLENLMWKGSEKVLAEICKQSAEATPKAMQQLPQKHKSSRQQAKFSCNSNGEIHNRT